jgi:hypothetical protein
MSCPLDSGIAIRQHTSSTHSAVREDKKSCLWTASGVCLLSVPAASRLIKSKLSAHNSPALYFILYNLHGLIILYYSTLKFTVEELVLSLKQHYDIPTSGEPILQPNNLPIYWWLPMTAEGSTCRRPRTKPWIHRCTEWPYVCRPFGLTDQPYGLHK